MYTVEPIDADSPQGELYHLTGYRRPLLRFELKKVADVHRYNGEFHSVLHEVKHGAVVEQPPPDNPAPSRALQAPSMSHNPSQAEIQTYNNWADRHGQPRFGVEAPRRTPWAIPKAANLRNAGGHVMITRNMRTAYHASS